MHRLAAVSVLAAVLLVGCGTEKPTGLQDADASFEPAPSSTPTPVVTPTPTPSPTSSPTSGGGESTGPLADFPLAAGLPAENENDGSPVVVSEQPATRAFSECGQRAWDPRDGTSDVIGVDWSAEAEWSRGRTLVLYPSVDAATASLARAGDAITACPRDGGDDTGWTAHTPVGFRTGDQSFGWMDRYQPTGADGFDPGLTVYHVVRVGRAVLFTYEYTEANGTPQGRDEEVARTAKEDQPVVTAMGDLAEPVAFTPDGAAPFRLGMGPDEIRAAAPDAVLRTRSASCTELEWTRPDGQQLFGAVDPDPETGLVYLSSPQGTTADGVGSGSTVAELRAAYPGLAHADNGLWHVDLGATSYAFDVDADGGVDDVMVVGDDQHCAG